jgi:hypothetical protein
MRRHRSLAWFVLLFSVGAGCFQKPELQCETDDCGTTAGEGTGSGDGGPTSVDATVGSTASSGMMTTVVDTGDGTETGIDPSDGSTSAACAGEVGCDCTMTSECDEGLSCFDDTCQDLGALHPVPPSESQFMWQNVQTEFIYDSGQTCTGMVTVAMGDQATCYVGSDDELRCAGRVFSTTWGTSFTGTGQMGVEQVFIRPTFNSADGNGMCLLTGGVIRCMGRNNNFGVYGTGGQADVAVLTQWGNVGGFVRMGTGTWDQLCAINGSGDVFCAGFDYGPIPAPHAGGATTFWIDPSGVLRVDEPVVWRAASGRTECTIRPPGLDCMGMAFGPPGEVVDGGALEGAAGGPVGPRCWLTSGGDVQCSGAAQITYFERGRVLALATNSYTDSMCAVYDDGSLWCLGSNDQGKLGTGDMATLLVETEVQTSGSVRVGCG